MGNIYGVNIPSEQLAVLPNNSEHIGVFTVKDDLAVDFEEPTGLSYLTSPMNVFKSEIPVGTQYTVLPEHPPIDGDGLHDLLNETAPYKSSLTGLLGVIDDWNIVDKNDGGNLVNRHAGSLGTSWTDFLDSRPAFLQTYQDAHRPNFGQDAYRSIFGRLDTNVLTPSHLVEQSTQLDHLVTHASRSVEGMVELLEEAGQETAHDLVYTAIKREINKHRDHPITRQETVVKRWDALGERRRRDLTAKLLNKVNPAIQLEAINLVRDRNYETVVMENGQEISVYSRGLIKSLEQSYAERRVVRKWRFGATVISIMRQSPKYSHQNVVLPNSEVELYPATLMTPAISWTKNRDGEREFILPRVTHEGDGIKPTHHVDGVLGVIATAYASPDIRGAWPSQRGMGSRSNRTQFMGAAQIPVLALMYRSRLLKSPLLDVAEALAA